MSYVQIIGFPPRPADKMEVIDNDGKTRACKRSNSVYPVPVDDATATYTNDRILVCGVTPSTGLTDQCYIYEKEKLVTALPDEPRQEHIVPHSN